MREGLEPRWPARFDPAALRAAWWALRALAVARRKLRAGALRDVTLPAPPPLAPRGKRGVEAVLRRRPHSCLERSLVLQRWLAAQGEPRDVVIAVTSSRDFQAHAWLDGDPAPVATPRFEELLRLAP